MAISDREVEFHFDQKGNRELPQDHRRPGRAAEALVGRHRRHPARSATSPSRRWSRRSARAAYKIEQLQAGCGDRLDRASRTIGRAKLPVKIGRENFDTRRYVYFQDDNAAWQAFTKGGFEDIRPENRSQRWATGYNFPAFKAGDVIRRRIRDDVRRADAGLRAEYAAAAIPGPPRAPGADLCLRLREHEPHAVLRSLHAHRQLFRGRRAGLERPAAAARSWRSSASTRTSCRPSCSPRNSSCRSTTRRRRRARTCAARSSCSSEAGWINQGRQAGQRQDRRAVQDRDSSATTRPTSVSPRRSSAICASSASTPRCASSTPANTSTAYRNFDFDIVTAVLAQSQSPGNEQRDFWSSQGGRHARLAQSDRASRTRSSTRWSTASSSPRTATTWSPPPMRSTGCCCGTTTSCRNSTCRVVARLLEQVRHSREAAELYRRRHRIPGGSTRPRKRRCKPNTRARIERRRGVTRRDFLALGAAAAASPLLAARGLRRGAGRPAAARPVGLRRPQIRAGLHAFRLRQSRRAEGRAVQFPAAQLGLQPEHARPSTR